ncbi:MAG: hypothetical protein M0Z99_14240 [Betaproteobacteria bacterium]|nr:hypothetical protein [Betaproteobacteria bacterium]
MQPKKRDLTHAGRLDGCRVGRVFYESIEAGLATPLLADRISREFASVLERRAPGAKEDLDYLIALQGTIFEFIRAWVVSVPSDEPNADAICRQRYDYIMAIDEVYSLISIALSITSFSSIHSRQPFAAEVGGILRRTDEGAPRCYKCGAELETESAQRAALEIYFVGGFHSSFADSDEVTSILCRRCSQEIIRREFGDRYREFAARPPLLERKFAVEPLLTDEHTLEPEFPDPLESIEERFIQEAQVEKHKK